MANRNGGFIGTDGLDAPDSPTSVSASGVGTSLSVTFTAPTDTGTSAITGFRAQAGGVGTSGTSSPLTITSLTSGTSYNVSVWAINAYGYSAPSEAISATPAAARGVFMGGLDTGSDPTDVMDYIQIDTDGNATDFGDLQNSEQAQDSRPRSSATAGTSSSTRGIISGGKQSANLSDNIRYITIASTGNSTDFGDLNAAAHGGCGLADSTRGILTLGYSGGSETNTINYVTIASVGDSTDFGNLTSTGKDMAGCASPTRGVVSHGDNSNVLSYITIQTTGNSTDFGDLTTVNAAGAGGVSSETRGVFFIGKSSKTINYITIASAGNATDFGDLQSATSSGLTGSVGSPTRGVTEVGNLNPGGVVNVLEKVTIASTGNAADYGDLSVARYNTSGCSNNHGGLQ